MEKNKPVEEDRMGGEKTHQEASGARHKGGEGARPAKIQGRGWQTFL